MTESSNKTGSVFYYEPLHVELNDCFGALKDSNPDMVFSSRNGPTGAMEQALNDLDTEKANSVDDKSDTEKEESKAKKKKMRSNKCKFLFFNNNYKILNYATFEKFYDPNILLYINMLNINNNSH